MKIYAIAYEWIDEKFRYYVYLDTWLSERKEIENSFYEELKARFTLSHTNNKSFSGMYFMPEL